MNQGERKKVAILTDLSTTDMFDTCHSLIQTDVAISFFFLGDVLDTHLNGIGPCCIAAVFIVPAILPLHDLCVTASAMPVLQLPLWNICCGLGSVGLGKGRGGEGGHLP